LLEKEGNYFVHESEVWWSLS